MCAHTGTRLGHARTHPHHNPPPPLSERRLEQMLRNLRCKRELELPPPTTTTHTPPPPPPHTHTRTPAPVPHLSAHSALRHTHQSTYFTPKTCRSDCCFHAVRAYGSPLARTCTASHSSLRAQRAPHPPPGWPRLIRGTMWHSIPSGTRQRLCQLCIVLCPLESTRPSHRPALPPSLPPPPPSSLPLLIASPTCLP